MRVRVSRCDGCCLKGWDGSIGDGCCLKGWDGSIGVMIVLTLGSIGDGSIGVMIVLIPSLKGVILRCDDSTNSRVNRGWVLS